MSAETLAALADLPPPAPDETMETWFRHQVDQFRRGRFELGDNAHPLLNNRLRIWKRVLSMVYLELVGARAMPDLGLEFEADYTLRI